MNFYNNLEGIWSDENIRSYEQDLERASVNDLNHWLNFYNA